MLVPVGNKPNVLAYESCLRDQAAPGRNITETETSEVLIYNPSGVISRRIKYITKEISELALALAKYQPNDTNHVLYRRQYQIQKLFSHRSPVR